jgi:DNA invertase Pin-like site-specific DNA recombinase
VYTRKSNEEGLEQAFNSLDAQREAGLDYIRSQKHTGWAAVAAKYDDGGYSGGNVERPGLKRLLEDINHGRIDVVVVYKVDRLSRSLADFARLMQLFDEKNVSFVSVTQQFNTTTSMGRLTLNMLLSFAQFEREVTGERIRDKIAATKRKGFWVCGQPPLGYRVPREGDPDYANGERVLRIVKSEAVIVRSIFTTYAETKSLLAAAERMNAAGHTTRVWTSSKGLKHGGRRFNATNVDHILRNPVYIGLIAHRRGKQNATYPGQHDPIIPQDLWDRVHESMHAEKQTSTTRWTEMHLLKGKLRTFEGWAMSPSSSGKSGAKRDGTQPASRTLYYCSQKAAKRGYKTCPIKTINATHLDDLVRAAVVDHILLKHRVNLRVLPPPERDRWIRELIHRVVLAPKQIAIELEDSGIAACRTSLRLHPGADDGCTEGRRPPAPAHHRCLFTPTVTERDGHTVLSIDIALKRHDNRRVLVAPDGSDLTLALATDGAPIPQPHLVRAIGQAFAWQAALLRNRTTMESIAKVAGITPARVAFLLQLTRLSPTVIRAVLTGNAPSNVSLLALSRAATHLDWSVQEATLGVRRR